MAVQQSVRNASEPWTDEEVAELEQLAADNLPISLIGLRLGRPDVAVKAKAGEEHITLLPRNRPPYGTS
ncbi:hypothetical protein ACI2LF_11760 [Kribbella sp. NPDC020789]